MKQRVITGLIGLALFLAVLFFYGTVVFDLAVCAISLLIVHELLLANKITKNVPLTFVTMAMSLFPYFLVQKFNIDSQHMVSMLILVAGFSMFLILLKYHETIRFEKIAVAFLVATLIPFSLITLIKLRDEYGIVSGIYYTLLAVACAWGADTGAYFAGRFFGKHKLAPKISPNKTVEGLIGGVISSVLFVGIVTIAMYFIGISMELPITINYPLLVVVAIFGSLIGVLGDLTASVIKRHCEIKDFGSIMPGHGGALDRFDSVLFTAPFVYIILKFFVA